MPTIHVFIPYLSGRRRNINWVANQVLNEEDYADIVYSAPDPDLRLQVHCDLTPAAAISTRISIR